MMLFPDLDRFLNQMGATHFSEANYQLNNIFVQLNTDGTWVSQITLLGVFPDRTKHPQWPATLRGGRLPHPSDFKSSVLHKRIDLHERSNSRELQEALCFLSTADTLPASPELAALPLT